MARAYFASEGNELQGEALVKIRTCVLIQVMDTQVRNLLPKEGQAAGGQGWG